jgi:hypothetical protein
MVEIPAKATHDLTTPAVLGPLPAKRSTSPTPTVPQTNPVDIARERDQRLREQQQRAQQQRDQQRERELRAQQQRDQQREREQQRDQRLREQQQRDQQRLRDQREREQRLFQRDQQRDQQQRDQLRIREQRLLQREELREQRLFDREQLNRRFSDDRPYLNYPSNRGGYRPPVFYIPRGKPGVSYGSDYSFGEVMEAAINEERVPAGVARDFQQKLWNDMNGTGNPDAYFTREALADLKNGDNSVGTDKRDFNGVFERGRNGYMGMRDEALAYEDMTEGAALPPPPAKKRKSSTLEQIINTVDKVAGVALKAGII